MRLSPLPGARNALVFARFFEILLLLLLSITVSAWNYFWHGVPSAIAQEKCLLPLDFSQFLLSFLPLESAGKAVIDLTGRVARFNVQVGKF